MTSITDSQPQVINLSPEEFTQLPNPPRLIDVRSSGNIIVSCSQFR